MINLDKVDLASLSEEERKAVLQILNEVSQNGSSEKYTELLYADYEEIPVSIYEFLHNPRYLGKGLINEEGKYTVFPYWESLLQKLFPNPFEPVKYNTLALTGAIGLGKSFEAVLIGLYELYRMLCLKDPYLHYGLQPIDKITFALMNITLDAAKGVAWDKFQQLAQSSEWFMNHGTVSRSENPVWTPGKKIELVCGSQSRHIIGRAVFWCLDGDTLISTDKGAIKLQDAVDKEIRVHTIDEFGNCKLSEPCTVKPTASTCEEIEIQLEDNTVIKCTPNHLLMLKDGSYKRADELTEDDELFDIIPYGYVYVTTNKITGHKYVGQHSKPYFDPRYYGSGMLLQRAMKKYNKEDFEVQLLEFCMSKFELDEKEKFYIEKFNTVKEGYNIASGGQGGDLGPEVRKRISEGLARNTTRNTKVLLGLKPYIDTEGTIHYVHPETELPPGCMWGNSTSNKIRITNGIHDKFVANENEIPPGYYKGTILTGIKRSEETKHKISESQKLRDSSTYSHSLLGKVAITDGIITRYIEEKDVLPEGFWYGNHTKDRYKPAYAASWTDERRREHSIKTSGMNNPMFGKGYKILGEKNGRYGKPMSEEGKEKSRKKRAKYIFTYEGVDYYGEPSIIKHLSSIGFVMSSSGLNSLLDNPTGRMGTKYPELVEKITRRLKDEN